MLFRRHRPEKLAVAEAGKKHRDQEKSNVAKTPSKPLKIKPALEKPDANRRDDRCQRDTSKANHQLNITQSMKRIVTPAAIQVSHLHHGPFLTTVDLQIVRTVDLATDQKLAGEGRASPSKTL